MQNISFNPYFAQKYGMEEAIIFQNILYWCEHNRRNCKNFYDGTYWVYNTAKAFSEQYVFMNERKIRYSLKNLEDKGLILSASYNVNKYDRTKWYAVSDFGRKEMRECIKKLGDEVVEDNNATDNNVDSNDKKIKKDLTKSQDDKLQNCKMSNDKIVRPIPNLKTNINKNLNTDVCNADCEFVVVDAEEKSETGKQDNAFQQETTTTTNEKQPKTSEEKNHTQRFFKPTVGQIQAYCKERGNSIDAQYFFDYYESKGWLVGRTPMKSWQAAVRTWERNENTRNASKPGGGGSLMSRIEADWKPTDAELKIF